MVELQYDIGDELVDVLELYFAEFEQTPWVIRQSVAESRLSLIGYFSDRESAQLEWRSLMRHVPRLDGETAITPLADQDWMTAYRAHVQPFSIAGFHWVPLWCRDSCDVPDDAPVIFLDPGMAFGTGQHPTTRLCIEALFECRDAWSSALNRKCVLDAGCGSGILALTAARLGFGRVTACDHDDVAVDVTQRNIAANALEDGVRAVRMSMARALDNHSYDLIMANILSSILMQHLEHIVSALNAGGVAVLSGMLEAEKDDVVAELRGSPGVRRCGLSLNIRHLGEWFTVVLHMPRVLEADSRGVDL